MQTGLQDYSPDRRPSSTESFIVEGDHEVLWVLGVRGLGVIVLRTSFDDENEELIFNGASTFTKDEIGYTDKL